MPDITPFLWFEDQAEEAAEFYISVFPNSRIVDVSRYGDAGPGPAGSVMVVRFELDGKPFLALNGGKAEFAFNESVSFVIDCSSQDEVDYYWENLLEGGEEIACGWLKDRYGLRWQVVPSQMFTLLRDADPERARRATEAMLSMKKLDIAEISRAADGAGVTGGAVTA
ncbi:MAG TPA: VOC family protein [Acidimicrobiales bacterium]|nr:VOC family protein [Acidimicrobiales bacterium]